MSFKQLVLVNNVADAIVGGVLDYTQLLPTCNVSDFILALQKKFGLVFICDDTKKTISVTLIDDNISREPDVDLTRLRQNCLESSGTITNNSRFRQRHPLNRQHLRVSYCLI